MTKVFCSPLKRVSLGGLLSCVLALMLLSFESNALQTTLPLKLPYAVVSEMLAEQLFVGEGSTANIVADNSGCNVLTLSEPSLSGDGAESPLVS